MMKKIIYRKPLGNQDRFMISTTHRHTKNVRRSLELLKEMYVSMVNFHRVNEKDAYTYAIACEEVALLGAFKDKELIEKLDFAVDKKSVVKQSRWQTIPVLDDNFSPEKLRMKVYAALVQGAVGIEYNTIYDGGITRESKQGPLYRYIQEMNYRITQIGRTLIALKNVGVYCSDDVIANHPSFAKVARPISESKILAEQELPAGTAIGEFEDKEGNRYLLYQNVDYSDKKTKAFSFELKKNFRVYRVNPHDGKQMVSKESIDTQKILIMPGDADLLRYQDTEEEAYLIEYALKK